MGLDGSRTLIHAGFLDWCNDGSIFEQDISEPKLPGRKTKSNQSTGDPVVQDLNSPLAFRELESLTRTGLARFLALLHPRIACKEAFFLQHGS
jgi:hypothetical protein